MNYTMRMIHSKSYSFFVLLLIFYLVGMMVAQAENKCSANGDSFSYSENFVVDVNSNLTTRRITTNTCPNHYSNCQRDTCSGLSSAAEIKNKVFDIPANPILVSDELLELSCIYGTVGIALNGVPIYSKRAKGTVCTDAIAAEGLTFDKCGGHADPETHEYHYHILPSCLLRQLNFTGSKYNLPSAQLGWSLDGFPIYGPTGPFGIPMLPCGVCGAHSIYCLDSCNGFFGALNNTNAFDGFLYRYYMTGNVGSTSCAVWVHGLGECEGHIGCCTSRVPSVLYKPYTVNCFRGCTAFDSNCHDRNHTVGTVEDYVPTVSHYIDSVYEEDVTEIRTGKNRGEKSPSNRWDRTSSYPALSVPLQCEEENHDDFDHRLIALDGANAAQIGLQASNGLLIVIISFLSFLLCVLVGFLIYVTHRSYHSLSSALFGTFLGCDIEHSGACGIQAQDECLDESSRHTNRSDESLASASVLDDLVTFDDRSSNVFSCLDSQYDASDRQRNNDDSARDECIPVSRIPCLQMSRRGRNDNNEDDTPWAI